jgi:hypothetical protein
MPAALRLPRFCDLLAVVVLLLGRGNCRAENAGQEGRTKAGPALAFAAADLEFLHDLARDVVQESRVPCGKRVRSSPTNTCGFTLLMPGGKGGYPAFWIRDFAMSLESGLITNEEMAQHLRLIARCQNGPEARHLQHGLLIPPFAVPDHINFNGAAVFYPGTYDSGDNQGVGQFGILPPVDDHYEFVHVAWCLYRAAGNARFLEEPINGLPLFQHLTNAFDAPAVDAQSGLVATDGAHRAVGFGFCDGIWLTGKLLFPSLLRYRAAGQLAELCGALARPEQALAYRQAQQLILTNLAPAFAEPERVRGWLLAATGTCRQPDVWGTLYAIYLGVLRGPALERARGTIAEAVRNQTIVFEGAVRHIPTNFDWSASSAWEKTSGEALNTYQNGAYWHTPTGWLIAALKPQDAALANQVFNDYLHHLRINDFRLGQKAEAPWECFGPKPHPGFGPKGYSQNGVYMTSVALPWAVLRTSNP